MSRARRRQATRVLLIMAAMGLGMGGALYWGAGGRQGPGTRRGEIVDHGSGPLPTFRGRQLTLMSWNIAYARGPIPDNSVNRAGTRAQIGERLRRMGALVRERGVDVLLLQEVDFDSRRSRRLDELALLAKHSGLRYSARAVSWRANYVPFPYWPPSQHYGRVLSGGAVLSRFPIQINWVTLHPKPAANPWWYNLFYLFRYSQRVKLRLAADQQVWVVNNHLEAWDKGNRAAQAQRLLREVQQLRPSEEAQHEGAQASVLVVGGDLNTVPPEAKRKHGFVDEPRDDYRNDPTLSVLRRLPGLREIVPLERYVADEAAHFSFPCLAPTRRLDYLFVNGAAKVARYEFVRTGDFSDHLPVVASVELPATGRDAKGALR